MRKFFLILLSVGAAFFLRAQNTVVYDVYLRSNFGTDTMHDGNLIDVWGMTSTMMEDPEIPAKVLYCNEGDSLVLDALNFSQNEHHTIHMHGLDEDTRNDGDPATSFFLNHLQDTTYSVRALHAGTYLYHCHVADVVHVQLGMYGLLVVRAASGVQTVYTGGPSFDREFNWILSEVDESWHDTVPVHDPDVDTVHIPPYRPDYFLINGHSESQLLTDNSTIVSGQANESILLRIGAIGFFDNLIVFPNWLNAEVISSDGRPLPGVIVTDSFRVAPGERYDFLLHPTDTGEDFIEVHFVNMNTGLIWNTQFVPVSIQGFESVNDYEMNKAGVKVFPNPSEGMIYIQSDYTIREVIIQNSLGEKLDRVFDSNQHVDLSQFPSGLYVISVSTADGLFIEKVMISR